jgi:hypothetical protein
MGRGSSTRRRSLRLQLGVSRKLTVFRWIGSVTVGVMNTSVRTNARENRSKAKEGAEKSCRLRRRWRGQRKGKQRSRGRHPRSRAPIPTQPAKERSERTMMRHLRACDHWWERQEEMGKLFQKSKLYSDLRSSRGENFSDESYAKWRCTWQKLRSHIIRFGEGVEWCSRIGPSFSYWLEQRFGIIVRRYTNNPVHAAATLRDWSDRIRIRNDNFKFRTIGNRSLVPRFIFVCAFCKGGRTWTGASRLGRCPHCSRPAIGAGGRGGRPKRT